ncbi:hypothetical protein [Clostridium estertheticum]|uniref:hypothetical protein n=1 Tax=Clostridium estertheticum TaxID=238834 RepID=UPI001CF140AD|nr:hypothetical protein [Clostridium estertheticum]MCB2358209.1 hypothetical protein [Clostridium estertheticum]
MDNINIRERSLKDIKGLKKIGEMTFYETFKNGSSKKDMEHYLKTVFLMSN